MPDQPPIKLPAWPDSFTLGGKLADLIQLDDGDWLERGVSDSIQC